MEKPKSEPYRTVPCRTMQWKSDIRERGHRMCASLRQGKRDLQPIFHSSKEGCGVASHLDLQVLNDSVMQLTFKMLTLRQILPQIRSEDWFVTIDLKDAYFHISILLCDRKFLRFAFGGKAYQYRVLPFGLALSPCIFTKCIDAALAPLCLQGIRILNSRFKVLYYLSHTQSYRV